MNSATRCPRAPGLRSGRRWFFYERLDAEPDPRRLIALWVQDGRDILGRIAPIMRVVRDAAGIDPDMADQWTTKEQQRATAYEVLARRLADRGALKPGMTVDDATDIVIAVLGIEVYLLLAARGWSPRRWEEWTISMLTAVLLRSPPAATE